jgi:hypothetical protein
MRKALLAIGKGLLAGIVWQVGTIIGALVPTALGIPTPSVPPDVNVALLLPLGVLVGVPVAVTLGELAKRLHQPFWPRLVTLFWFMYLVYGLLQTLEQILFTENASLAYGAVSNLLSAGAMALAVTWLWRPDPADRRLGAAARRWFGARSAGEWAWRLAVAALIYVPIYYGMGRIVSPVVGALYETEAAGLILPDPIDMVDMQYLRGVGYVLAALPIVILWRGSRRSLWLWIGGSIFMLIAATPILLAYWFPLAFRLAHAFELTVDSMAQAFLYAQLLWVPLGARE